MTSIVSGVYVGELNKRIKEMLQAELEKLVLTPSEGSTPQKEESSTRTKGQF